MSVKNIIFPLFALLFSSSAIAQHSLIDRMRPSGTNIFVTSAIEGEYGKFTKTSNDELLNVSKSWRGYGIRNGVSVEAMKFVQFSLSHTMLNLRSNSSSLENARGSRIGADVSFSFSAPITNIQFGLGAIATQLDYQDREFASSVMGSGYYQSMGFNYFASPRISCLLLGKRILSRYAGSTGSKLKSINSTTDNVSLGLSIWL